jgi:hypothetical protein
MSDGNKTLRLTQSVHLNAETLQAAFEIKRNIDQTMPYGPSPSIAAIVRDCVLSMRDIRCGKPEGR